MQSRRRSAKGVKKSGGVSGKSFITKPLTVIRNLAQGESGFNKRFLARFSWQLLPDFLGFRLDLLACDFLQFIIFER
jgi:hypothetical protein